MSGGALNYVCHSIAYGDVSAVVEKHAELRQLVEEVTPFSTAMALKFQELLSAIDALEMLCTPELGEVARAVEWWLSADYSEEDVRNAIAAYEAEAGASP